VTAILPKKRKVVPVLVLFGLPAALLGWNLHSFYRLTDEAPIAQLRFVPVAPQRYAVELRSGDFCKAYHYTLDGDEWRLDARFLKWKPVANLLGLDALYRLDRLSGRYRDIADAGSHPPSVFAIGDKPVFDLTDYLNESWLSWSPVDTLFGSSVYESIDPAYKYTVYRSQSGLLVRKQLLETARYEEGSLVIEIEKPCH